MSKKLCCFCGIRPATTRDHIPPKCVFPEPRPVDLITVPACEECNKSTASIDEEFRVFVNLFVGKKSPEAERLWRLRTLSTVKSNRRLLNKAISAFQPGYVTPKHKIILWDDSPHRIFEKMVRGLYFHHFNEVLADRVDIIIDQIKEMTTAKVECVKSLSCNYIGCGQFLYRYGRANDDPLRSVWLFVFHRNLVVMGQTNPV